MVVRGFKYRLYPSSAQEINLLRVLRACHGLYNMALAERKYAYQLEGRRVALDDTEDLAKRYRDIFPCAQQIYSQTAQSVVKQVDEAFQGFFRRIKASQKAGYPRFKSWQQFTSFEFKQYGRGAKLDGKRLKLFGIRRVRVHWHRPLKGKIKTVRIVHRAGHGAPFANFDLSTRWIECACGLSLDRDHNAAINILKRTGWVTPVPDNVAPLPPPSGDG